MLFRLSDPLIEPIYPATKMYVIHVCQTWLFSFVSFPESLSTEKRQLFKVEADLRDKITNLFNGIYISICLACFKWFEKTSKKNCVSGLKHYFINTCEQMVNILFAIVNTAELSWQQWNSVLFCFESLYCLIFLSNVMTVIKAKKVGEGKEGGG